MSHILPFFMFTILAIFPMATAQEKKPAAPKLQTTQYRVHHNLEEGLIAEIHILDTEHFHIPGGTSRTGGGAGVSGSTQVWKATGKYVLIPHVAATKKMATDHLFVAQSLATEKTQRISPTEVVPIHRLSKIIPDPLAKKPVK